MRTKSQLMYQLARDESGVTAVIIGLSMTILMGAAGLAVDVGLWYNDKRIAQGAADSAAFSAAVDAAAGDTAANVTATAKAVAAQYGQVDGANGVTVTVNRPPKSGSYTTNASATEIIVQRSESTFFASFFMNSAGIAARAVGLAGSTSGGKYCVLALDTAAATTVSNADVAASNGVNVDISTCGMAINATGADALYITGGAVVKAGTVSISGNYAVSNGGQLVVSGTTSTSAAAVADPYGSVAVPTPGACAATNSWNSGTYTISPGTFCNGMTFANGAKVTMNAGVYIVDRGAFYLTGGATLTATAGVTIVLTSSSGANYATASIDNGTTLNITAPTTGTTKGIAFLQDRRAATTGVENFAGGTTMNITGALYFPSQMVDFSNGATVSTCTQLIAYRITYTGGTKLQDNCTGFGTTEIGGSSAATSLVE